jgi:hypothetical protein
MILLIVYADKVKGFLTVEMNAGQMVEDVRLAVNGKTRVEYFGRMGGIVPGPDEVFSGSKGKNYKRIICDDDSSRSQNLFDFILNCFRSHDYHLFCLRQKYAIIPGMREDLH